MIPDEDQVVAETGAAFRETARQLVPVLVVGVVGLLVVGSLVSAGLYALVKVIR